MEEKEKSIICFLGCKGSGKDYNSKAYIKNDFKKIAFADALREVVWDILGYHPIDDKYKNIAKDSFTYSEFKQCELFAGKKIFNFIPIISRCSSITSIRKILQNTGSVFKELFGENYWTNIWYKKVLEYDGNVVVTDVRFPYEINKILKLKKQGYNVTFIWCQYENADWNKIMQDKHESEALSQFIYLHSCKYKLHDGSIIDDKTIKRIIKDFMNSK